MMMRKLLLIAALLTFGSTLNAMSPESDKACRKLVENLAAMALGGAPLDVMHSHNVLPTSYLKDWSSPAFNADMVNSILVYVYFRIGRSIMLNGVAGFGASNAAKDDFCSSQQASMYFK